MPADWKPAKRRQKDLEAGWTRKHGKSHFGFKLPVNVEKKFKVIRRVETGTASTHDSQHFEAVLDATNTNPEVYADKAYPSAQREENLAAEGYRNHIQRKGKRNQPLSAAQQRRNHRIAKTRARVEHDLGAFEQMGGKVVRTVGQARVNFAMTMMATCYNVKRLAYFHRAALVCASGP